MRGLLSPSNTAAAPTLLPAVPYARERDNVLRLAATQALAGANSTVVYATGAIVGALLAPTAALETLPISNLVVGMAGSTVPTGAIAQRHGRRAALLAGTGCGVLTGLLAAVMASGVLAGMIGPQLVTPTMNLWPPYTFAATSLAQAAVAAVSARILLGVQLLKPTAAEDVRVQTA